MVKLRISATICNEWDTRCIGDVIPELSGINYYQSAITVSNEVAKQIAADCEFYMDPKAVDATAGERAAYRALRNQIAAALAA